MIDENNGTKKYTSALVVLTILFFMWGFITSMNDILIPFLKKVFELNYTQAMLVQFSFFGAYFIGSLIYFILSVSMGDPIMKIGYKKGIMIGLIISAAACAMFYPAAELKIYGLFLTALFILGLGFTLLQIAANPFVTILGPSETAASRLNLSQGVNSFGHTIAPIIGGFLVFKFFSAFGSPLLNLTGGIVKTDDGLQMTKSSVQIPYLMFSGLFLLVAVIIAISKLPKLTESEKIEKGAGALKYKNLTYGMIAIFLYVGAEVTIGSVYINFLKELVNFTENDAKSYLAFYWGGAMIGRFAGSISQSGIKSWTKKILGMIGVGVALFLIISGAVYLEQGFTIGRFLPFLLFIGLNIIAFRVGNSLPHRTMTVFAVVNIFLLLISLFTKGMPTLWCITAIGLFNSIMWPNIFPLAIKDLGKYTSQGSSLLVMMILGGALLPVLQGFVADATHNLQLSFVIPIASYIYLVFYGLKGYIVMKRT